MAMLSRFAAHSVSLTWTVSPWQEILLPPCIETLQGNPYGLAPPELRVARDYAAFIGGELSSSAVASDTLRPQLAAAPAAEALVMELAVALAAAVSAPAEEDSSGAGQAVPQYSAALEAAASLGQTLRRHYIAEASGALDAVLGITAALSGAAAGEAEEIALVRGDPKAKAFSDPKNTEEKKQNGAAISPWVHAHIGLARLGVGEDAFGTPIREAVADGRTLNLSLIDGGRMTFTVRAT